MYKILLIALIITMIFIYCNIEEQKENFSIIRTYNNMYYPYANPYSNCYQTLYGDISCYPGRYYTKGGLRRHGRRGIYRRSWW